VIKIYYPNGEEEEVGGTTFTGGEEHINLKKRVLVSNWPILITARSVTSSEIIRILLVTDALRRYYPNDINLSLPYLPYARQDRACNEGDAFSLEVFANIINSQNYKTIFTIDTHSPVAAKLIRNLHVNPADQSVVSIPTYYDYFVAPDKGAVSRVESCAALWNLRYHNNPVGIVTGTKTRDVTNGNLVYDPLVCPDLTGKKCLIVDDICDGGMTFILLAKELKRKGAESIDLYVSHGIFSRGTEVLWEAGIDKIYTTDSIYNRARQLNNVTVIIASL
jgi:ribose-phosphate pyrophosphokinase